MCDVHDAGVQTNATWKYFFELLENDYKNILHKKKYLTISISMDGVVITYLMWPTKHTNYTTRLKPCCLAVAGVWYSETSMRHAPTCKPFKITLSRLT